MIRLLGRLENKGLPPGTIGIIPGEKEKTTMAIIDYDQDRFEEKEVTDIKDIYQYRATRTVSWININGRDIDTIKSIDEYFGIHPLVLEDIVGTGQRPKVEDYGDYVFIILKMIRLNAEKKDIAAEQISIIVGKNFVLSFQEMSGDVFEPLRERIRKAKGIVRKMGADYLAYALVDAIVDHYFTIMEEISSEMNLLEESVVAVDEKSIPVRIHRLKQMVLFLRKQIWPLRDVISSLLRDGNQIFRKQTLLYLRDVYDHLVQANEGIEAFRENLSSLHDIHLAFISNKMNEIMKILTMYAAVFIPLTFIAGIYGMNFEHMPELKWRYGYFAVLGAMSGIFIGLIAFFKRKKWM